MTDAAQTTVDQSGIERTGPGEIVDQSGKSQDPSNQNTNQGTDTQQKTEADGKTLLTEGKKAEEGKKEGEADKKDAVKGAPEKYEDYKVPEGYTLDPAIKTEADALFKGLGLDQTQAQSLVDFYTAKTTEAFQQPYQAYKEMTDGWRKDAESHADLRGKLGPGQEVNVRIARALEGLGDAKLASDFRELMDLTGAGNHQAFIRVIDKLAQRVTEGTHVAGNGPSKGGQSAPGEKPPSAAAALWPKLKSSSEG
jgi:hypothetical protein